MGVGLGGRGLTKSMVKHFSSVPYEVTLCSCNVVTQALHRMSDNIYYVNHGHYRQRIDAPSYKLFTQRKSRGTGWSGGVYDT